MRTVALVQARMGSTRFPGKMLELLGDFPVLHWVLKRTSLARTLDEVVLATTDKKRDDKLVAVAAELGIEAFRWHDEDDVLGRFAGAAREAEAGIVLRICADNPFIDADVIDHAVEAFTRERPDYAFNQIPRLGNRYADGLGTEVFGAEILYEMDRIATAPIHREAATSYIWDNAERYSILAVDCPPEWDSNGEDIRLDVDWPEDLERLTILAEGMAIDAKATEILSRWRRIYAKPDPVS